MKIRVLTLFPQMFEGVFGSSILQRAREKGILDIACVNIRDYADNKHKKVDDYPYGGGAGMVMTPQPIFASFEGIKEELGNANKLRAIYLSPKGKVFNQSLALELSQEKELVFICGHYEGIDQRVIDELVTDEISIGDYVLTGGEIPAMVVIDTISRMIPGVLSQEESYQEESFYSGLLEYPHYTRPKEYKGLLVPEVLMSGNHNNIHEWRRKKSLQITLERRPDLLQFVELSTRDLKLIDEINRESKKNL